VSFSRLVIGMTDRFGQRQLQNQMGPQAAEMVDVERFSDEQRQYLDQTARLQAEARQDPYLSRDDSEGRLRV
jgi:hypothetical protein